jgi:hypothetical protein
LSGLLVWGIWKSGETAKCVCDYEGFTVRREHTHSGRSKRFPILKIHPKGSFFKMGMNFLYGILDYWRIRRAQRLDYGADGASADLFARILNLILPL